MSVIDCVREQVRKMKPGEWLTVSGTLLQGAQVPPPWTPAEWVLEGIIGAAYEYSVERIPMSDDCIYRRRTEPTKDGQRTYVSADRRDLFKGEPGNYQLKDEPR